MSSVLTKQSNSKREGVKGYDLDIGWFSGYAGTADLAGLQESRCDGVTITAVLEILGKIAQGAMLAISVYLASKGTSNEEDDSRGE